MFAAALQAISPQAVECFFALAIGFAFAGSCANGYRPFGEHFPSVRLLESGPATARLAAIPLLVSRRPSSSCATAYAGGASNVAVRKWSWWQR
jgi:hypothetical protein